MKFGQTRILVATDLTERSNRALARACLLAQELGASLLIAHVVDDDLPKETQIQKVKQAEKTLSGQVDDMVASRELVASFEVLKGNPDQVIADLSKSSDIDLTIFGVDGAFAHQGRTFADTTAGKILLASDTAALLVKEEASQTYWQTVVGVDFSVYSRAAIRQALRVAPGANLHMVHAYQLPFQGFLRSQDVEGEVAYAERLELNTFIREAMDALEQRAERLGALAGTIHRTVQEGDPRNVLREVCNRLGADLLVIGTHARTGVSEAVWGSVAADILQDPPCDLLIVRPS
jgi:nucleotide-binding universal stress UspA family protein